MARYGLPVPNPISTVTRVDVGRSAIMASRFQNLLLTEEQKTVTFGLGKYPKILTFPALGEDSNPFVASVAMP